MPSSRTNETPAASATSTLTAHCKAALRTHLSPPLLVLRENEERGARPFFGYARNISCGGLFIATANPRTPGERFTLLVPIPPLGEAISCQCEVVWGRNFSRKSTLEPGMGLRFVDLPETVAETLDRWVRRCESKQAARRLRELQIPAA
ncbi:PilZ domain-containing protein [Desulfuromonas sp. CSMB_57]|jgi:uncharacterized protein (TIGR02266 family)|uniref:PilZ domain-containing protein n=1 Tax=Desulfuromonas sp. CSMB_57 TaxID=2807629 RepID=UPI001CD45A5C|nr:PilZ domain-containing protein [Desulfuromonas sp. CSMB_57]